MTTDFLGMAWFNLLSHCYVFMYYAIHFIVLSSMCLINLINLIFFFFFSIFQRSHDDVQTREITTLIFLLIFSFTVKVLDYFLNALCIHWCCTFIVCMLIFECGVRSSVHVT